ncbi:MerR family transcriptional regulator [Streptococcus devriesei]|uniref:MerR family transcriptional regulator n=1 Tax=Streptococcus devriesei TaxID=231233 RepID=UPI000413A1E6|nr:MerR family transcriptional regulator [Streptococcus devriesei]
MKESIGEFAKRSKLSIHTLRYYENQGLLKPQRDSSNRRCYTDDDYRWLLFILRLKAVGMPLKEIKRYSELREKGAGTYLERMQLLENHLKVLDKTIQSLLDNKAQLLDKIQFYKEQIGDSADS